MHLRAKGDLSLRRELAPLLQAHAPFERVPEAVRSRLGLADPATLADVAVPAGSDSGHQFTNGWFQGAAKSVWDDLVPQIDPTRILEIGSFEGASSCYLIDTLATRKDIEIHCIDTWEGGVENAADGWSPANMSDVEQRFLDNIRLSVDRAPHKVDVHLHKGRSDLALCKLLAEGRQGYFDFIYVDGSHQAPDVLCDAVLAFRLLRENGVIAFDDYLWKEPLPYGVDPIRCPKPAIDAFTNLYCRKISIISAPLYQLYVRKLCE
ncbi:class I SAM-dependent methyltransferase [Rhizorhabdus dicambivorans]|uniref:Class I SAM-dependent methyltransferase n=2 Tax=Rhizorhabdus dicambivorans TaxID=1850238 RepID=A0A2A4FYV4_9SPHN|nr:class I SAM-dependent methyltransferase [Rhizorhabdus dicambivorans]PCE43390.1 class I SAM-dependent methyltransferase [Rhizorhabdus dicambivorans]